MLKQQKSTIIEEDQDDKKSSLTTVNQLDIKLEPDSKSSDSLNHEILID